MKKIFTPLILSIFVVGNILNAQAPEWEWAKSAKFPPSSNSIPAGSGCGGTDIVTDANGNSYVTGWFEYPEIQFGNYILANTGARSIFIAKYDAAGNVIWAVSAGNIASCESNRICLDVYGNIYIIGQFTASTIFFGNYTLNAMAWGGSFFMAKYNSSGNIIWAETINESVEYINNGVFGISTDASGNIYITGGYEGLQ